jgi:PPOX class probable F420-dependent enzyme
MEIDDARRRFSEARVARLATVEGRKQPHLVPVTFALGSGPEGDAICFAIDSKPKSTRQLQRLFNISENSRVSLLVDFYDDEDWTRLWWVRADGSARILEDGGIFDVAIGGLRAKYPQYEQEPPAGPVVVVEVKQWRGWSAADSVQDQEPEQ